MDKYIKNIKHDEIVNLNDEVQYLDGQIVSKTLAQSKYYSLTLFAFAKGEEISSHDSTGDAMIQVLDGNLKITIGENDYELAAGETIIMPAKVPHAVYAMEQSKMLLTVIFPIE